MLGSIHAADAGTPFSVVKAVDDMSYVARVKEVSPATLTVARLTSQHEGAGLVNDPGTDLAWYAGEIMSIIFDRLDEQPELPDYTVVNLRVSWEYRAWRGAASGSRGSGPVLFVQARNLLDETYATRGIYAFDFLTFQDEVFLTPAPGRRYLAGAEWRF